MALRQRRSSIAYRFSVKSQGYDNPSTLTTNALQIFSAAADETIRNGYRTRDDLSPVSYPDANFSSARKGAIQEEDINGNISPNNFPTTNSRTMLKSIRTNDETKKEPLNNEKSSTTCTIQ
jgi:hypothetical protein